jgi:NADPH:quinone reductase-like Zn-dependent oxidoreductase
MTPARARRGKAEVLDYRAPDVAQRILALTGGRGVDRIIEVDFGANQALDGQVIMPHGVIAACSSRREPKPVLDYHVFARKGVTLRFVQDSRLQGQAREAGVAATVAATREGWMNLPIAAIFPLDRTAEAHEALAAGAQGKVVVEVAPV